MAGEAEQQVGDLYLASAGCEAGPLDGEQGRVGLVPTEWDAGGRATAWVVVDDPANEVEVAAALAADAERREREARHKRERRRREDARARLRVEVWSGPAGQALVTVVRRGQVVLRLRGGTRLLAAVCAVAVADGDSVPVVMSSLGPERGLPPAGEPAARQAHAWSVAEVVRRLLSAAAQALGRGPERSEAAAEGRALPARGPPPRMLAPATLDALASLTLAPHAPTRPGRPARVEVALT